jgi:intraflagellar transport protein 46
VGDIDAMIKVGAPEMIDGVDDSLGLAVIDEPCAAQSDPTVLDLQLRSIAKTATNKPAAVSQVANVQKDAKTLDNWIKSITDLHREKPPQTIQCVFRVCVALSHV